MSKDTNIRWGWLKAMYIYTIIGAGVLGFGMIIAPDTMRSMLGWPAQDPVVFGICGSVYLAFGLLSILGLRSPVKFSPVLLLQLTYKLLWCIGVFLPLLFGGNLPPHAMVSAVIFATYIIGDLIAIPFSYVLGKEDARGRV